MKKTYLIGGVILAVVALAIIIYFIQEPTIRLYDPSVKYFAVEFAGIECEGCGYDILHIGTINTDDTITDFEEGALLVHVDFDPFKCFSKHYFYETAVIKDEYGDHSMFINTDLLLTEEGVRTLLEDLSECEVEE